MESFEVSTYLNRIDLLKETVEQIQKDFGESGFNIHFSGKPETAYQELVEQITPFIQKNLQSNYTYLMQVLYKIDIPEKHFKDALNKNPQSVSLQITELIIKRELQKVVIRNHYKKQSSDNSL